MANHGKTTKYFPGLINKNQGLSRNFQESKKIQDFTGLFQDVATLTTTTKLKKMFLHQNKTVQGAHDRNFLVRFNNEFFFKRR